MADDKKDLPDTPVQSEEVRNKIVRNSAAGGDTAIGNERRRLRQEEDDEGFDGPGGSEQPIAGGEPKADFPAFEASAPVGAQAQPANLTTNGSVPVNHVASPTGPIPVSAVTADPHRGAQLVQDNLDETERAVLRTGAKKLSRSQIESMSAGDLRAVAADRGYDIGEYAGTRSTRQRFIRAQQEDDDAASDEGGSDAAATSGTEA